MRNNSPIRCSANNQHDFLQVSMLVYEATMVPFVILFVICDVKLGSISILAHLPSIASFQLLKLLFLIIRIYFLTALIKCVLFFVLYAIMYIYYIIVFYTYELRLGLNPVSYRTSGMLREHVQNIFRVFRSLQVLHQHTLKLVGPHMVTNHMTFSMFSVYSTFVLVKYWIKLNVYICTLLLLADVFVILLWSLLIEAGRKLFKRGNKVINSWKLCQYKNYSELRKTNVFIRSCRPLLLKHNTMLFYQSSSLLVFYRGIVIGTARALLMT